ncbi:MAG: SDR family NAD(P)-dependent oxidoreductase [Limisphaerales bacterium]
MQNKRVPLLFALFAGGLAAGWFARQRQLERQFEFRERVVVITGASRGLGFVLARQLVEQGAKVVLLARNEQHLRRAETELTANGGTALGIPCDIKDQAQVNAAIERAMQEFGRVDVLINNAGTIQVGPLDSMTMKDFESAMAVHFYGSLHTTLAVLPHMRRAGGGRIVNISSIGGKIALPHMVPYTASKFALVGLSDALRAELRRENIFVTTVCPGLMRTGSPANAHFKGNHQAEYTWFAVADSLPIISMNAERAAKKILKACQHKTSHIVLSLPAKAAVLFSELLPGVTARISAGVNCALPENAPGEGKELHTGWESQSRFAPSLLTHLSEKAAVRNNQLP